MKTITLKLDKPSQPKARGTREGSKIRDPVVYTFRSPIKVPN